jgi:serine O-acetyltransferase
MQDFVKGLGLNIDEFIVGSALKRTMKDVRFHYDLPDEQIISLIKSNSQELSIFLFRLGQMSPDKKQIHGLMRQYCACEYYFNSDISEGFYPVHGIGSVIGSRTKIGKGFMMYQNCTIGHMSDDEGGCTIGNEVTMYPNSMILGGVTIGDRVVVGAQAVVFDDVPDNSIVVGNPAKVTRGNVIEELKKHRPNFKP